MRASELAVVIGARLEGPDCSVSGVAELADAGSDQLAALFELRFRAAGRSSRAGCVLVSAELAGELPPETTRLVAERPRAAWGAALRALFPNPVIEPPPPGRHRLSEVHAEAQVHAEARVGPFVSVGAGAVIGAGAALLAGSYVGAGAQIGAGTTLHPGARVFDGCSVGAHCHIGAGAAIGGPGFGLDARGRLPHPGAVRVGDRVSIGAQTCVDRATIGVTVIEDDAHIDNLVQVAHNAFVGRGAVLCAQVGLCGGARVEAGAIMAGQSAANPNITIGARSKVGGQAGVTKSIPADSVVSGHPAEPHRARLRRLARQRRAFDKD